MGLEDTRRDPLVPHLELEAIRGALFGLAFDAKMYSENPELSNDAVKAYLWIERNMLRLCIEGASDDEAICGFGG